MDTITGLPAHPLLVHFPIVMIPVATILVILFALIRSWRHVLDYLMIAVGGAIALSVVLAASSGEALEENVDESAVLENHASLGGQLQIIGVIFGISLIALGLYHLLTTRRIFLFSESTASSLVTVLLITTIAAGLIATVWDVRTGHSGVESVWSEEGGDESEDREEEGMLPPGSLTGRMLIG